MKKTILPLISLFIISQTAFGQKKLSKLDSINSNEEVEKLIRSFGENYDTFKLKKIADFESNYKSNYISRDYCKLIADSLNITNSFYKADFDNNGFTDILVIGDNGYYFNIFIVMNHGQDSYKLNKLTRSSFQECAFPKIINDTIIRYYYSSFHGWEENTKATLQQKDLIFKFGDFIELNSSPKTYQIEHIEYQTGMCDGFCPEFNIKINKDKRAILEAEEYNKDPITSKKMEGTFKSTLKNSSFLKIIDLLNYIDFPNLKNDYIVNWSGDHSCTLTITYNNGLKKIIKDYGLIGTYGLDRLYQLLFELRFNQNWVK